MSSTITSLSASITATSAAATSSTATKTLSAGKNLKVVGIILAIVSGCLIGSSFVFKKKGLLRSQAGGVAAYAFVEAIVVTPLGALSVVICAILSSIFLKERLTFFGWLGCGLCILGSVIIALNGPTEDSVGEIRQFQKLFISPGFIAWISVLIAAAVVIIVFFAPSMIGGISVSVTTGLGAAIVQTAMGDNQVCNFHSFWDNAAESA
ncbi:hypothetical protein C0989_012238 [Termitomyces sp. Mn162]|nr:hypothetical protein C0989_012238 [Termitomyces sp. Mn162]